MVMHGTLQPDNVIDHLLVVCANHINTRFKDTCAKLVSIVFDSEISEMQIGKKKKNFQL